MSIAGSLSSRAARVALVMSCLFAVNGVVLPFLPRWLEAERGLGGAQIGLLLSLPLFLRLLVGPAIAFWADGCADRRTPLRVLTIVSGAAFAVFFLAPRTFPGLLVCGLVALCMTQGLYPLVEASLMRAAQDGRMAYGRARGLASGAFMASNILGGLVIARFGQEATVVWVLAAFACAIAAAWRALPNDPAPAQAMAGTRVRLANALTLVRNRRFLTIIVGAGLIQGAHGFYYGFSTLAWRAQELSPQLIGWLWAFGVLIEIVFLWSLALFERRVSPEALILIGGAGAVVRWTAMGFAPLGLALWPLQGLHALSFAATHVGAMRLLFREAPEEAQALAQTLYSALAAGVLIGAATLLSGVLYDAAGAKGYWAMAAMAACGVGVSASLLAPARRVAR